MNVPKESAAHEHLLRMILMIAACFAIGCVGFFLAVLLEHGSQASQTNIAQLPSIQAKNDAMQSLTASEQTGNSTPASTTAPISPTQADPNDEDAAAKLQVLEGLNSQ